MTTDAEKERLLQLLQSHGESFMQSFGLHPADSRPVKKRKIVEEEEEEWGGILDPEQGSDSEEDSEEDEAEAGSDFEQSDDEFTSAPAADDKVVVFSESKLSTSILDPASKAQMKAFLSSKVSKVTSAGSQIATTSKTKVEDEEEKTNIENDAILHKLVHTTLLSGSLSTELNLTPAQRKKALAGRILELTGESKLGKGEKSVRQAEKQKASKSVREGLARKQKEVEKLKVEEAKNLGNYHPSLRKLFEPSQPEKKIKRERGMKVGVGNYKGGMLRLGRDEINMASAQLPGGTNRGAKRRKK